LRPVAILRLGHAREQGGQGDERCGHGNGGAAHIKLGMNDLQPQA
jgi:hypothetical protein